MGGQWPFTAEKIASRLALIRPFVHRRRLVLEPLRLLELREPTIAPPLIADPFRWPEIPPNTYWGEADLNFLLKGEFAVPEVWGAEHLALHLPLGVMGDIFNHPEALVHIDDVPIGSADRYHHTLPLAPDLADGYPHGLALHGWTGLAGWPPDPTSKAKLFMGELALVQIDPGLQAFCDLAEVVLDAARTLDPNDATGNGLLEALDAAFKILDTRDPMGDALYASVPDAMAVLKASVAEAGPPLDKRVHGIGHAHMDIAYLWPIAQIRLKNARTYSNVLRLMNKDADFRFSHSQPQLYAYLAEDYPEIFDQVKARVSEGRWEVLGGTWVEPDLNIPGPEALVQHFVLARRYMEATFGEAGPPVLWLPDTFGFPAQIPQLMRHAGLKWFVTNKLNWNQRNKVPWSTHHWEGLDGSRVLAHILTTPRDVQYLPFPTNYKSDLSAREVLGTVEDPTIPAGLKDLPICYGYGDGGGGPTRALLAKAHAFSKLPGMPQFRLSSVRETFEAIESQALELNTWVGEHYMEGHRGVFTSQGWIKRANRRAERALHEAEALSVMAGLRPDLSRAWELLCLNQFHDIVTGTSIGAVFEDARRDFAEIMSLAEDAAASACQQLELKLKSVVSTSPLSGPRVVEDDKGALHFFADLKGYAVTPLGQAGEPEEPVRLIEANGEISLENAYLTIEIDQNGRVLRAIDRTLGRDILATGEIGNQLQAFEDRPVCWDAWDIDPSFEDRMEIVEGEAQLEVLERGPLRARVRVTTRWRHSSISQVIELCAHSRRVDFITDVDWHERHTLLKAAFPTSVQAPMAEFDIQWGAVERATTRETSFDEARFEVPAHKWARLTDTALTVAVLNDCKYGYDARGSTIRITLIKSSTSPDPDADQGEHVFTYALFAAPAALGHAPLDHEAYALNTPLRMLAAGEADAEPPFVRVDAPNVIIETLKPAFGPGVILRVFEAHGTDTTAKLTFAKPLQSAECVTFHEAFEEPLNPSENLLTISLNAFEIRSLRLQFGE